MPYIPVGFDPTFIPKWNELHSDLHPRWISMEAKRRAMHSFSYGDHPGYKEYGEGMTREQLEEACTALGLPHTYINYNINRIVFGDVMLAYIPKDEWVRRLKERIALPAAKEKAVIEAFKESGRAPGIKPVVYETEEDFKDQKAFHTRESNNRVGYRGASA